MAFWRLPVLFSILLLAAGHTAVGQETNITDAKGRKQGPWRQVHPNGQVRYEGEFKDDRPLGLFRYYFADGKLKATNNHAPDGSVASHHYHPNGKIQAKGVYRNQKKDSLWQYFNENEMLVLEETYRQNLLHGAQRIYLDSGQLGEETHFRDSVKHGPWNKFFGNSRPWIEANYKNGSLDGPFKIWQDDGKPKVQGNYADGLRIGTWLMFNLNGSLRTQDSYSNGILKYTRPQNGDFEEFYGSGIPKSIHSYKKGKLNGEFKEWYDKGEFKTTVTPGTMGGPDEVTEELVGTQLKLKGWFTEGVLNGKLTCYKEDGSTDRVEIWENGELKSTVDWKEKAR
ncbi:MAG: hypothetical protein K9J06_13290 [Flavobacteriales bacterium]|nr:hypothetical protein [Flavobacteriales bacterium]